jgi:hypothetical protein
MSAHPDHSLAAGNAVHKQLRAALWAQSPPPAGAGTVGSLLEREPFQFGLRGDPYLWRELRARFADTPLPDDCFTLRTMLRDTIEQVVGEPLTSHESTAWNDTTTAVYLPEFGPGHGMSAGTVHLPWWNHTGLPILLDRYSARCDSDARRDEG